MPGVDRAEINCALYRMPPQAICAARWSMISAAAVERRFAAASGKSLPESSHI